MNTTIAISKRKQPCLDSSFSADAAVMLIDRAHYKLI